MRTEKLSPEKSYNMILYVEIQWWRIAYYILSLKNFIFGLIVPTHQLFEFEKSILIFNYDSSFYYTMLWYTFN